MKVGYGGFVIYDDVDEESTCIEGMIFDIRALGFTIKESEILKTSMKEHTTT